jgi:hypothetical protein
MVISRNREGLTKFCSAQYRYPHTPHYIVRPDKERPPYTETKPFEQIAAYDFVNTRISGELVRERQKIDDLSMIEAFSHLTFDTCRHVVVKGDITHCDVNCDSVIDRGNLARDTRFAISA